MHGQLLSSLPHLILHRTPMYITTPPQLTPQSLFWIHNFIQIFIYPRKLFCTHVLNYHKSLPILQSTTSYRPNKHSYINTKAYAYCGLSPYVCACIAIACARARAYVCACARAWVCTYECACITVSVSERARVRGQVYAREKRVCVPICKLGCEHVCMARVCARARVRACVRVSWRAVRACVCLSVRVHVYISIYP